MTRRLVGLTAALWLTLGAGTAWADAPPKANNCAGVFASGLTPELTAGDPGAFGEARSSAGRAGTVGESEKAFTEALASCGTP
jgi:hypothetical protein